MGRCVFTDTNNVCHNSMEEIGEKYMSKKIIYIMMMFFIVSVVSATNCTNLTTDIEISIDPAPYSSDTISFFATLPSIYSTTEFSCWSYIKADDEVIQVNPQKTEISKSKLLLFSKREESREYFTSQNGVVNAYFTYDNLVSYTTFVLGVRCVSGGVSLIGEKCVTPTYKELKNVPARGVWAVDNMDMLVVLVFVIIILIIIAGAIWRSIFR